MAFAIGFLIGIAITFMIMSIIGEKIMNDTYMEGYNAGKEEVRNKDAE